jgi:hypothetical protein
MKKIKISTGAITLEAEINDSKTAQEIWNALPIDGTVNRWGEEIYFDIPVEVDQDSDARADVEIGELGYWPVGQAFCIFFGRTPVSSDDKPRAASPVNVFGKVTDDSTQLKSVQSGAKIRIERSE